MISHPLTEKDRSSIRGYLRPPLCSRSSEPTKKACIFFGSLYLFAQMKREQTDAATREAGEATASNYDRMPTTSVHRSAKRTCFSETTDRDLYYLHKEQPATTNSISLTNNRYSWLSLTKKIIYFLTRRVFLDRKPPVLNGPEQKTKGSLQRESSPSTKSSENSI